MRRAVSGLLSVALLVWALAMSLAVFVVYRRGFFFSMEHPENSFLPHPVTRFGDFFGAFDEWNRFAGFGGVGFGVSYFPAMYIPLEAIQIVTLDPWKGVGVSRWVSLLWTLLVLHLALKELDFSSRATVGILVLLSYPYLLILHTANLDSWIVPLLMSAVAAAHRGKWEYFGVLIGAAGAMKGLPMMFALVAVMSQPLRVSARALSLAATSAISLTGLALLVLPGGVLDGGPSRVTIAIQAIRDSQAMYVDLMVNSAAGIHYGHSFLNSVHAIWGMEFMRSDRFAPTIFLLFSAFGISSLWLLRRMRTGLTPHFFVCGAMMCVAPGTSTDYKLMFLASGILSVALLERAPTRLESTLLIVAIFAMAPKPYLRVGVDPWGYATVYLTTLLLILMMLCPVLWWVYNHLLLREHKSNSQHESTA
jgi:hypothetical protein